MTKTCLKRRSDVRTNSLYFNILLLTSFCFLQVSQRFFFSSGFSFTIRRTAGKWGGYYFKSALPLPPTSQTLRQRRIGMVSTNIVWIYKLELSLNLNKPCWYKPSHILFLIKKRRSGVAQYLLVLLIRSNWKCCVYLRMINYVKVVEKQMLVFKAVITSCSCY